MVTRNFHLLAYMADAVKTIFVICFISLLLYEKRVLNLLIFSLFLTTLIINFHLLIYEADPGKKIITVLIVAQNFNSQILVTNSERGAVN